MYFVKTQEVMVSFDCCFHHAMQESVVFFSGTCQVDFNLSLIKILVYAIQLALPSVGVSPATCHMTQDRLQGCKLSYAQVAFSSEADSTCRQSIK